MAKAVRKRLAQEHSTFADATVGAIHKPGGCAILGMEEGTATIVADGTLRARGIVWDMTGRLWCATAAAGASTTGDWTLLAIHPDKQWAGGDITWTGGHEFDASVDISGNVAMDGDLSLDGKLIVGDVSVVGDMYVDGTADFSSIGIDGTLTAADVSISGFLGVDGTVDVFDEADFSDVVIDGTLTVGTNTTVSLFKALVTTAQCVSTGDQITINDSTDTASSTSNVFEASTDGYVYACTSGGHYIVGYVGDTSMPGTEYGWNSDGAGGSIMMPIAKGEFWLVAVNNPPPVNWSAQWRSIGV